MSHSGLTAGIDIGTTSVKGVVADRDGHIVAQVRVPHPVLTPSADRMEHDARRAWRDGPCKAMAELNAHQPDAVAVSTMVPSLTAVDRNGIPKTPGLLYGDARGREGVERHADSDAGEALGFLKWTAAAAPEAHGYWPAPAVANFALGGVGAMDFGTAYSSAPMFDGQQWDQAVLAQAGAVPDQLPAVEFMGTAFGKVSGTDCVLAAGCADGFCEQLVAGSDNPGDVLVICGTTLIIWAVTDEAVHGEGLWTIPHGATGKWAVGGPSNAGGLFQGWVDRLAGKAKKDEVARPDDVPVFAPYIRGERVPIHDADRRATLHGLSLTQGPAAIRRAGYEAAGFVVRHQLDLAGVEVTRLVASGGGTRVDGWMQGMADATGLPVHAAAVPEGAALGAAYLAGMALGHNSGFDAASGWSATGRIVEPDPVWAEAATERYAVFRAMVDRAIP